MAQYYRPRRFTSSSVTSETQLQVTPHRDASHRYPSLENPASSSSILVFPNPPSERDSSRDESGVEFTGSTLSLPTDLSLESSPSRSRSRDEDERSWHDISRISPSHDSEEEWELDSEELRSRWDDSRYQRYRWRQNHNHTYSSSNLTSLSGVTSSSLKPQPPFHLPFLSCLQTFLNLDESTLHLLSRSPNPNASVLFPFSPGPPPPSHNDCEEEEVHGGHKLLLDNPDKFKNGVLFEAAMDHFDTDTNPFLAASAQFPVWKLFEIVIEGGLKVWREAQIWHTKDEPRLVGV